ncbi:MAG: 2-dehydropantoate 2-reductase [Gemmatimonadales bacterium]
MRFAVVGAGAIGGYVGGWLAAAGGDNEVTFIARGANLTAIRAEGMRVIGEDGTERVGRSCAFERPAEAGPHDVVLLAVKAHQVAAVAPELGHLCHAGTTIVTMQNGIPWWYFHQHGGPYDGRPVNAVDPDGTIGRAIDPDRIVGSVLYPAAVLERPGVVRVIEGKRISVGEPGNTDSQRVRAIAAALTAAGFRAPVTTAIREEIWLKLWGNLSMNPISALTHTTLAELLRYPLTRELCYDLMREAEAVAGRLGVRFRVGMARRIAGAEQVGEHKTSMLQDVEAGKPLELEALVGAVVELARLTETPTPHLDAVYACTSLLAKTLTDHGARLVLSH